MDDRFFKFTTQGDQSFAQGSWAETEAGIEYKFDNNTMPVVLYREDRTSCTWAS